MPAYLWFVCILQHVYRFSFGSVYHNTTTNCSCKLLILLVSEIEFSLVFNYVEDHYAYN